MPQSGAGVPPASLLHLDTFPDGPFGELRGLLDSTTVPAWLVARRRAAPFSADIAAFVARRFERVFELEPGAAADLPLPAELLPPITIREPEECLERESARRALGATPQERLVFLIATGGPERERDLVRVVRKAMARVAPGTGALRLVVFAAELPPGELAGDAPLPPVLVAAHFPAMELLRAADALVTAGGAARLGLRPIVIPQARRFDDQFARAAGGTLAATPEELEAALAATLAGDPAVEPLPPGGAAALGALIAARFRALS
jgi:hypothetical protein